MNLLLAEDNEALRETLQDKLSHEGFVVDAVSDGDKALSLAKVNEYKLIILDKVLPKKNAEEICLQIRKSNINTPILILSAYKDPEEKANLLDIGADDYVTKPFSFIEFLSRIKALTRRPYNIKTNVLKAEDLTINQDKQVVTKGDKEVYLTRKEYLICECLMEHKGEVVSRGALIEKAWDYEFDPFSNTLEAHITNLRRKIGHKGRNKVIKTVPGRGYKIN